MDAPPISTPILKLFRRIVRRYFRRQFHGVRVSGAEQFSAHAEGSAPLIVYANHGSWWDPLVAFLLAERMMPQRQHFAPMDSEALERYGILKRLGVFAVETRTARGAVQFLRTGEAVASGGGVLWVTPQGAFVDTRVRPIEFKPGLAALAVRVAAKAGVCNVLPLAIEYIFWDERLPECLLRFGETVTVTSGEHADAVEVRLIAALGNGMEELKRLAIRRDASLFATLTSGTVGAGGLYALGQRAKAALLRRPYRAEHTILPAVRELPK